MRGLVLGCALVLVAAFVPPAAVQAQSCGPSQLLVDVFVIYNGPGSWSGGVCSDGEFRASDLDGEYSKRLTPIELGKLRGLLAAMPADKHEYSFGTSYVDAPMMLVSVRSTGVLRKYFIGADVKSERGNPLFPPVAHVAIFVRDQFESKRALSSSEWFAEALPTGPATD